MTALRDQMGSTAAGLGKTAERIGQLGFAVAVALYVADMLYAARTGTSLWVTPLSLLGLWTVALGLAWLMVKLAQLGRRLQVPLASQCPRTRCSATRSVPSLVSRRRCDTSSV